MGLVCHVRNGGEVQVLTHAEMVFIDGFDQETNTIYEFYGCYFHGCPHCFPRNRDVRRNCHKDRTMTYWIPNSLKVGLGFRIPIVRTIQDSLTCIPDSTSKYFPDSGIWIPLHCTRGEIYKQNIGEIYH